MNEIIIKSLNIGLPTTETFNGKEVVTGICKTPATGPVRLSKTGFEGDGVSDTKHHGGIHKAICVYSVDHYPYWEKALGIRMDYAAFGENLSIANLPEEDVCIGDIFVLGTAVVQVSQPRQPCKTLAARYGRADFVKLVVDSGYTGFYLSVIDEGVVEKDSPFFLRERDPRRISVAFANRIYHHEKHNLDGIMKVLEVPALSDSWRASFEELRKKAEERH